VIREFETDVCEARSFKLKRRDHMTRLNQIIAVEKSVKSKALAETTRVYHEFQKPALYDGLARSYKPKDEQGDQFPAESKLPQLRVKDGLEATAKALTDLFDITLTKDTANCAAKGTVKVGENVILKDAPVPYLLFLEKQLTDLHTELKKAPTLDPTERWSFDAGANYFATESSDNFKTKKVKQKLVKAEATDKHPAQVEVYDEDVVIGTWTTRKFSGALPVKEKLDMLNRIEELQKAIKFAREEANTTVVTEQAAGKALFNYIFGK
jgi:hypothetical protein